MKIFTTKSNKKTLISTALVTVALTSSTLLTGCAGSSKEHVATIAGSVIGGVAGSQFGKGKGKRTMAILGAIAGGMIGGNIGRTMDQQDQRNVTHTLENVPSNQKVSWNNNNSGTTYDFTPVSNKYPSTVNGQATQCRDYVMDAWIDGRMQQVNGRACKNSNGQWVNAT